MIKFRGIIRRKMELDLRIDRVEYIDDSYNKRIYLTNCSSEDMVWEGELINNFYIETTDLLDLVSYADNYIYTEDGNSYYLYDNDIISTLYDEDDEEDSFMHDLQLSLIDFLIINKLPAYRLDDQLGEGDGYIIADSVNRGIYEGVLEDEDYDHPFMEIKWVIKDDSITLQNPLITMTLNIKEYGEYPYKHIYAEFAKLWNSSINGNYDWKLGNYEMCDEQVSEYIEKKLDTMEG